MPKLAQQKEDLLFYTFLVFITFLLAIGTWVTLMHNNFPLAVVTTGVFFMMCSILGVIGRELFTPRYKDKWDPSKYV